MIQTNLTYNEAMKDVRARVQAAKTSFASGMGMLPVPRREAMYALYAFCREVDDIADDSPTAEIRETGLNLWRARISALFQKGEAQDSITRALLPAIEMFSLVEEDFQAIIEGMEMDAREAICAPSMEKLDLYCDHVASAVGRVSVRIFGDPSENGMHVAYHLGRALQLTNILRDLAEDASRGRLYLPEECLAQAGIATRTPSEVLKDPALPIACRALALRAHEHFDGANAALKKALWYPMRPARAMRNYYRAILERLLKEDWKDPAKRVSLPLWEKIWILLRGLVE